ncbi:hypothetical protein SAMN06265337_0534 [Hymenobacter gelipurpurascens]|uniref:Muconolactone delta-isomerase n=1 Tax=Hymenobacter gelipurpurascens TaxID=89968 RepID=A0A212T6Z0_9BACT|nr:hypothetical protein [Hymenobacter gelipurpurascens]SNC61765.1 hypothetical protein SAMN06265337_0534 [Hymenobacter gelipurpurascens]
MARFVVSFRLPDAFDEDFIVLIPRHRAFINRLIEDSIIEANAISADRSRGWVTMNGQHTAAIKSIIEQFPLYHFLREVEIDELFIYDSTSGRFPRISLN